MPPTISNNTKSTQKETEFPVQVYRKTEKGWQWMTARNTAGQIVPIGVSARASCMVLHRIQVRIKLKESTVIRRDAKLLISNPTGLRSLVLHFGSVQACQAFCDWLVQLNPSPAVAPTEMEDCSDTILAKVGQLLHDPDFVEFVQALETSLRQTQDGTKLLEAVVAATPSSSSG